ncbi:MAG: ribulose-phosphate 3-epimerase, partial [Pyrinomonadaceae bacterium]|nr:ribulose-phosphate 3-epimerase [Pyrinomonadaceae bacterium]
IEEALPFADFILIMSVNPGFGGQKFIQTSIEKVKRLREMISARGLDSRIEIDGGIDENNIGEVVEAGAELVVSGSSIFGKEDPTEAVREMIDKATVWV